ncbi:MAG: helix-turn-helix domain-containing protein [Verrucomicrobia bacterium]|nr:helix-turn-helix domain-containing protein [Verrucomicrobiota bacterium]MDA1068534.1 helix-turn-helix domain-containing protein [Verrucomicrobiota bacterium]
MSQPVVAVLFESEFDSMVELFRGIQAHAEALGVWRAIPLNIGEEELLGELVEHGNLAGLIGGLVSDRWIESHWLGRMPLVNVENLSLISRAPSVVVDDEEVGRLVAEKFLSAGFENFAYAGLTGNLFTKLRQTGFSSRLENSGKTAVSAPHGWVTRPLRVWTEWLLSLPRPIAVFCATDYTARRVIQAAGIGGLKVPEEVSVVGVGNIYRDSLFSGVPIASVELPYFEIGKEAGRVIDQYRHGIIKTPEIIKFSPVRLLERASSRFSKVEDVAVAKALDIMRARFHESPSIDAVSRETGVSRRLLEQKFQLSLSSTPYQELLKIKMDRVCQLLEHTGKRIIEISQLCGFSSQHQFSNCFKRLYGMSPRAFRESLRKES